MDRATTSLDDLWRQLDFTVIEPPVQAPPPAKSPKSIIEQYISKTVDAKNSLPTDKLMNARNITSDSVNSHWPKNNSNVDFTNGLFSSGSNNCELINSKSADIKCEFKSDIIDRTEVTSDRFDQDELLDMFREIKKEWYVSFIFFLIFLVQLCRIVLFLHCSKISCNSPSLLL